MFISSDDNRFLSDCIEYYICIEHFIVILMLRAHVSIRKFSKPYCLRRRLFSINAFYRILLCYLCIYSLVCYGFVPFLVCSWVSEISCKMRQKYIEKGFVSLLHVPFGKIIMSVMLVKSYASVHFIFNIPKNVFVGCNKIS